MRSLIVPIALGAFAVLQATLNRRIAQELGLGGATLLNAGVMLLVAVIAWGALTLSGQPLVELLPGGAGLRALRWWWAVPGCFGFALVLGLPWVLDRVGALATFVALVAAQTVTSLVWDRLVEGIAVTPSRLAGAGLAVAAVVLAGRR